VDGRPYDTCHPYRGRVQRGQGKRHCLTQHQGTEAPLRKRGSKAPRCVALQNAILEGGSCIWPAPKLQGPLESHGRRRARLGWSESKSGASSSHSRCAEAANACRLEDRVALHVLSSKACSAKGQGFGFKGRAVAGPLSASPLLTPATLDPESHVTEPTLFHPPTCRSVTKARDLSQKLALGYLYRCLACSHDTTPFTALATLFAPLPFISAICTITQRRTPASSLPTDMHRSSSTSSISSSGSETEETMQIFVKNVSGTTSTSTLETSRVVEPSLRLIETASISN
jgi:hypothetical protein